MPSSVFGGGRPRGSAVADAISRARALGNPREAFARMYDDDPAFRRFADSMRGKTPDQAFREAGLDFVAIRDLMR